MGPLFTGEQLAEVRAYHAPLYTLTLVLLFWAPRSSSPVDGGLVSQRLGQLFHGDGGSRAFSSRRNASSEVRCAALTLLGR